MIAPAGPLPACTWPASVIPPTSGAVGWSLSRTIVKCGPCVTDPMGACEVGPSDNASLCGDAGSCLPCVLACEPDQYGVAIAESGLFGMPEGGVLYPQLPSSCTGTIVNTGSNADVTWTCCPCSGGE